MIVSSALSSFALTSVLLAAPVFTIVPELELSSGYDSNIFFDAAALPEDIEGTGGTVLHAAPMLDLSLSLPWEQSLHAGYAAEIDQLLSGEVSPETVLRHRGGLHYFSPSLAQIKLIAGVDAQQLTYRQAGAAWYQLGALVELRRPFGDSLRAQLSYRPSWVSYDAGLVASEWLHTLRVSANWRLLAGLSITPAYELILARADPADYDTLRHGAGLGLSWIPPELPIEATAGYRVSIIGFRAETEAELSRTDLIHEIRAMLRVQLTRWLFAFGRYEGLLGWSNQSAVQYENRHVGLGGFGVVFGFGVGDALGPRRSSDEKQPAGPSKQRLLRVSIRSAEASRVSVVGTFNRWDPKQNSLTRGRADRWHAELALPTGQHRYMLWIDGKIVPPPGCGRWVPDGFGGRSCAVAVSPPARIRSDDGSQKEIR